jgi:hypothetical protein
MTTDDEVTPPPKHKVKRCVDCSRALKPYEIEHGDRDSDLYLSFALHKNRCCECFDARMGAPR